MGSTLHAMIFKGPTYAPNGLGHLPADQARRNYHRNLCRCLFLKTFEPVARVEVVCGRWRALVNNRWVDVSQLLHDAEQDYGKVRAFNYALSRQQITRRYRQAMRKLAEGPDK